MSQSTAVAEPVTTAEDDLWRGVLARSATLDGNVFYAVRSTGIYCRPSCPSPRPQRRNVLFFATHRAAEGAGFRPCRRCLPRVHAEAAEGRVRAEELRMAAEIQRRLLPGRVPVPEGWDLAFSSTPCREIGGDHVDVFRRRRDGSLVVALGDVAGKGAPAALLMSGLHAGLRAQLEARSRLPAALAELDRYLFESSPGSRFATLFLGLLEPTRGRLTYLNAGHPPALLVSRDGGVRRLGPSGLALGMLPGRRHAARRVELRPGDGLVLYSDGVSEAADRHDEELGIDRLAAHLAATAGGSAAAVGGRLEELVAAHSGERAPHDDCSWLVLRRNPEVAS